MCACVDVCLCPEIIEDAVKTYTLNYVKSYGVELLKSMRKKAEEDDWQLLSRPDVSFAPLIQITFFVDFYK